MSENVQRYDSGDLNTILITVDSGVTVKMGDLMFLDNADDLRNDGSSTATYYAYPIEYLRISGASLNANKIQLKSVFLGVAMDDKDGSDELSLEEKLTIATSGIFEFDMKPPRTVHSGDKFCASGTTTGSDMYNQKIMKTLDEDRYLGYFAEKKLNALKAKVFIRPAFGSYPSL